MSLLRLSGVDTYYGEIHILENLNLQVGKGEPTVSRYSAIAQKTTQAMGSRPKAAP